jgi:hypothetical protein
MKHNFAFTAAFVVAPDAPAQESKEPVRGRNAKMDLFLRKVNGSPRYDATAIEARMAKAPPLGKSVA